MSDDPKTCPACKASLEVLIPADEVDELHIRLETLSATLQALGKEDMVARGLGLQLDEIRDLLAVMVGGIEVIEAEAERIA